MIYINTLLEFIQSITVILVGVVLNAIATRRLIRAVEGMNKTLAVMFWATRRPVTVLRVPTK